MNQPTVLFVFIAAAVAEIAGCFSFFAWMRQSASPIWLIPGIASLILFAWLLTFVPSEAAGRTFAAYGGIYIIASLGWMKFVEGVSPDRWDALGAVICLIGAAVILFGPRMA